MSGGTVLALSLVWVLFSWGRYLYDKYYLYSYERLRLAEPEPKGEFLKRAVPHLDPPPQALKAAYNAAAQTHARPTKCDGSGRVFYGSGEVGVCPGCTNCALERMSNEEVLLLAQRMEREYPGMDPPLKTQKRIARARRELKARR